MARHNVDILIKARDRASREIRKTSKATRSAAGAFRMLKTAVAGIGVYALIRQMRELVNAYAEQEAAETALRSALGSTGQEVEKNFKRLKGYASELQTATVYGDEFTLRLMAQATNLGINAEAMDETIRQAIGLSTALRMDLQTALRYVSLATQGEFTMLRRYIPELRSTTDATEQLAIVNRVAAAGFEQARAESDTTQGSIKQLANAWGDLKEQVGAAIAGTGATRWLQNLTFWVRNAGLGWEILTTKAKLSIVGIFEEYKHTFQWRVPLILEWFLEHWRSVFEAAGTIAGNVLNNVAEGLKSVFGGEGNYRGLTEGVRLPELPDLRRHSISATERRLMDTLEELRQRVREQVAKDLEAAAGGGGGGRSGGARGAAAGGPSGAFGRGGGVAGGAVEARFLTGLRYSADLQRKQAKHLANIETEMKRNTDAVIDLERTIEQAQRDKGSDELMVYHLGG